MYSNRDTWQEKLDKIIAGEKVQLTHDDEFLDVAKRLRKALAPLQHMDKAALQRRQQLLSRLHARHQTYPSAYPFSRSLLLIIAVLALALIIGSMNIAGLGKTWEHATQLWHVSTSLDQIQGVSVASLSRPHTGLRPLPLLPAVLPSDTQASNYGVLTAASDPNVLTIFVADYHIAGQDVLLYEQPSDEIPFSSVAQKVQIGSIEGQLFQDDAGNNALQWYQHGMMCQLTRSKLVTQRLLVLASTFQPMKNWDVLL